MQANWKFEFHKWTGHLSPSVRCLDLGDLSTDARKYMMADWQMNGGVLLVSKELFGRTIEKWPALQQPDAIFIDEAHLALSSKSNQIYKALSKIETKRRILLTGSPFQNNPLEYFRMCAWMRPSVLNMTESKFEKEFAAPISKGMASDCTPAELQLCDQKSSELKQLLSGVVHRKDVGYLRRELPPMQQVILHVRLSKMQTNLCKTLKRHEKKHNITNYLTRYSLARPIHNHPACLLSQSSDPEVDVALKDDLDDKTPWWSKFAEKHGNDKLKAINSGGKVVLLMHILTHAFQLKDRVVVFSQCLKTLDFLEEVLNLDCWSDHLPSLAEAFPNLKSLGKWQKGQEYLRIDGRFVFVF